MDDAPCASALVVADISRVLYSASSRSSKKVNASLSLFLAQKNARRAFSRSDAEDKREKMMGVNDDVLDISLSGGPYRNEDFFPSHLGFCFFRNFSPFFKERILFSRTFLSFFHSFIHSACACACVRALCDFAPARETGGTRRRL